MWQQLRPVDTRSHVHLRGPAEALKYHTEETKPQIAWVQRAESFWGHVSGRGYCCPSRGKRFPFLHRPLRLLVLTSSSLVLVQILRLFSQAQRSADLFSAPLSSSSFSRRSRVAGTNQALYELFT